MTGKRRGMAVAVVGAALGIWAGTGQAQQRATAPPREGVGERIGEKLDNALRDVGGTLRERFAQAKASVNNMGVEARVYGRLHWDKALQDATIDLEVQENGVTTLKGAVRDAIAKARAVELAGDTVGVTQVVDQLSISPATRTIEAEPAPAPATSRTRRP